MDPNDQHTEKTGQTKFRVLNPVFLVVVFTLIILSLATGEAIPAAFTPWSNHGQAPIRLLFGELGWWLLAAPIGALVVLWFLSGRFIQRNVLQVLLSLGAFVMSTALIGLVFLALYIANTRY